MSCKFWRTKVGGKVVCLLLDVEADNLKSNVKKRETNEYVVFAIDTSNIDPDKDDEFKLIEKDDYDVKLVQNRFCDNKTFAEDSKNTFYFPAYRFVNHRKVLVDIFGTCQKNLTFDQRIRVLDLLVYKYMTTVTRWVTGRYPMTREDQMDHLYKRCIDEDGFGASPAPNHCFFLAAVGYTKNLDENGKIYREITSKFAGHLSVNRMVEDDYPVPLVEKDPIRGIVYNTTTLPSHIVMNALDKIYFNNSDHCFIDWQENFYGIVCFCGKDPKQCQFRPFLSKERVCAVGTSKYWIRNDTKPGADDLTFKFYDNKTFEFKPTIPMNFKENRNYFGSFCTIRYNFNREK
uniref:Uncharacterized protein n=1 Tax=Panagrolaimus sp. JU765 TaxID=591449 RepID=A0AC34QXY9_9BILA